jgi:hypothetical protein
LKEKRFLLKSAIRNPHSAMEQFVGRESNRQLPH